jgi:hypothetical protein
MLRRLAQTAAAAVIDSAPSCSGRGGAGTCSLVAGQQRGGGAWRAISMPQRSVDQAATPQQLASARPYATVVERQQAANPGASAKLSQLSSLCSPCQPPHSHTPRPLRLVTAPAALKFWKPTSPGQRGRVTIRRPELWEGRPKASLVLGAARSGGRNHHGRITVRHRGGGHKKKLRLVDFFRKVRVRSACCDTRDVLLRCSSCWCYEAMAAAAVQWRLADRCSPPRRWMPLAWSSASSTTPAGAATLRWSSMQQV